VTPPPINYDHIRIVIQTGNDDARKDSEVWAAIDGQNLCLKPSNNANNDGICPNGGSSKDQNGRQNWTNWSTSDLRFAVGAFTASAISSLQLHFVTHNHNGEGDDNWDLEGFRIFAQAAGQPDLQLYTAGKLDLSTGDDCMFRFGPHGGWQATWNFSTGGPPSSCPQ
jgi:hypothetical protein